MALSEDTPLLKNVSVQLPPKPPRRHRVLKIVLALVLVVGLVLILLAAALRKLAGPAVASATTDNGYICGITKNEAGYITLANKKDDHYFYWFFESESNPSKDPLLVWLSGGPGASSLYALLTENGPCTVQPDLTTKNNPYTWNNQANVIWLDQPTNVGFSYGAPEDRDFNGTDVGENLYWFLQGFIEKHPEFDNREFFIFGESYGGHYVPDGAHYIWQQSKLGRAQPGDKKINLQGIGIGNGWVDPETQYLYADAMAENAYNITFLTDEQVAQMKKDNLVCVELDLKCRASPFNGTACMYEQQFSYEKHLLPFYAAGRNPYDIREECDVEMDPLCDGNSSVLADFLNSDKARRYLNVNVGPHKQWEEINGQVNIDFIVSSDNAQPSQLLVADLLNDGIRVLVYNGDADLMCNWQSSDAWTKALEWKGKQGFNSAQERHFFAEDADVSGSPAIDAGVVRSFGNFTFLRMFNAGHMVPKNQPAAALDMVNKFLSNKAL